MVTDCVTIAPQFHLRLSDSSEVAEPMIVAIQRCECVECAENLSNKCSRANWKKRLVMMI